MNDRSGFIRPDVVDDLETTGMSRQKTARTIQKKLALAVFLPSGSELVSLPAIVALSPLSNTTPVDRAKPHESRLPL